MQEKRHSGSTVLKRCSGVGFKLVQRVFLSERKGRSFHVGRPKIEKAREPTFESLVRGIWRLIVSEAERRVREGV